MAGMTSGPRWQTMSDAGELEVDEGAVSPFADGYGSVVSPSAGVSLSLPRVGSSLGFALRLSGPDDGVRKVALASECRSIAIVDYLNRGPWDGLTWQDLYDVICQEIADSSVDDRGFVLFDEFCAGLRTSGVLGKAIADPIFSVLSALSYAAQNEDKKDKVELWRGSYDGRPVQWLRRAREDLSVGPYVRNRQFVSAASPLDSVSDDHSGHVSDESSGTLPSQPPALIRADGAPFSDRDASVYSRQPSSRYDGLERCLPVNANSHLDARHGRAERERGLPSRPAQHRAAGIGPCSSVGPAHRAAGIGQVFASLGWPDEELVIRDGLSTCDLLPLLVHFDVRFEAWPSDPRKSVDAVLVRHRDGTPAGWLRTRWRFLGCWGFSPMDMRLLTSHWLPFWAGRWSCGKVSSYKKENEALDMPIGMQTIALRAFEDTPVARRARKSAYPDMAQHDSVSSDAGASWHGSLDSAYRASTPGQGGAGSLDSFRRSALAPLPTRRPSAYPGLSYSADAVPSDPPRAGHAWLSVWVGEVGQMMWTQIRQVPE